MDLKIKRRWRSRSRTSCSSQVKRPAWDTSALFTARFRRDSVQPQKLWTVSTLNPNRRVPPQQVPANLHSRKQRTVKTPHLIHREISIGLAVFFPCGAHLTRRAQPAIVKKTQAATCSHRDHIQNRISYAVGGEQVSFGLD